MSQDNFFCTHCNDSSEDPKECCGTNMIKYADAEGFGLTDYEPVGTNSCDYNDDWN